MAEAFSAVFPVQWQTDEGEPGGASIQFPSEHWSRIRTNNPMERIIREIRRRTRVVGAFPDGRSALMLVAARLRHIAGTRWGTRKYLDMDRLKEQDQERLFTEAEAVAAASEDTQTLRLLPHGAC